MPEDASQHDSSTGSADHLLTHSKMYEIAEKYDIQDLKKLAKEKFDFLCDSYWDDPLFHEVAKHVFTATVDTDMGLRDAIINTISIRPQLVKEAGIKEFLADNPTVAVSVLERRVDAGLV
ncbi:hypothetical protein K491DRAFT_758086 [Lophiostoma macrostomum CBS 122681]|uniref:BTB domain-containing protein n=1 Tax=Lophiostoma macrostomum CBS 122681 TaxID=1314788 RepID=A0A6A6T8J9_9PLEO|nr:hypothetical protein K491DRAFT_758086 [Lophiostoma macrostomum CBS 122681]